jgi:site-specific recombinase
MPDLETFGRTLLPQAATHRALTKLHALFAGLDAQAAFPERMAKLDAVVRWVRDTARVPAPADSDPGDRPQVGRLRLLVAALEQFPECARALGGLLGSVLGDLQAVPLLARAGLPADRGLLGETMDRLSRGFLPEPIDERDLAQLAAGWFGSKRDLTWLGSVPAALVVRLARAVCSPEVGNPWAPLSHAAADALALISERVAGVGLNDAIRVRSPQVPVRASPFFLLPRANDAVLASLASGDATQFEEAVADCRGLVRACLETVGAVTHDLESSGVSVDVVYRLELITKNLERYQVLFDRVVAVDPVDRADGARRLLLQLLLARRKERELGGILRSNTHLLARKIIERAGHSGEHYITTTRGEWAKMLLSAGGGGVLTTGTATLKFLVSWGHFAPFVEGMLSGTVYAGSFILMQFLGFTLATKQPSMTAAALAGSMRSSESETNLSGLVTTIARITRSQLAAALGNIGAVIPTTVAFDLYYRSKTGHSFLNEEAAAYVVHSLHPTHSLTILYAALTGVLLWASSVAAGWLENWAVYRRLPEAIAEHRMGRLVGRRTMRFASRVFSRNISGIGGNTALGYLLGMTPIAGKFFGLPLDVRHVTLSTGALTLAVSSQGKASLKTPEMWGAAAGIVVIGLLNFGVSFVLALMVALRAREVERKDRVKLWASVMLTFLKSPGQFLFPPKTPEAVAVHGPVSVPPPPVGQSH